MSKFQVPSTAFEHVVTTPRPFWNVCGRGVVSAYPLRDPRRGSYAAHSAIVSFKFAIETYLFCSALHDVSVVKVQIPDAGRTRKSAPRFPQIHVSVVSRDTSLCRCLCFLKRQFYSSDALKCPKTLFLKRARGGRVKVRPCG